MILSEGFFQVKKKMVDIVYEKVTSHNDNYRVLCTSNLPFCMRT